jgi:hypothetical protein
MQRKGKIVRNKMKYCSITCNLVHLYNFRGFLSSNFGGAFSPVFPTFQDKSFIGNITPTFNPIDKVIELYDQIIKEKEEEISFLKQMLKEKN